MDPSTPENQDCLHCGGSGVEPYTEEEKCGICLGMQQVPEEMNREYYDVVMDAIENHSSEVGDYE